MRRPPTWKTRSAWLPQTLVLPLHNPYAPRLLADTGFDSMAPTRTKKKTPATPAQAHPAPTSPEHTLTGDFRLHHNFRSQFLKERRSFIVYLPPGYNHRGARRYPTLYFHDGQNVFDKATSVGEEWRADETAQHLIAAGEIEPLIMVGIYNTGVHRIGEYTPTAVAGKGGGLADAYGRMLVEELKPLIDAKYKTFPGAGSTGLAGSSLGGLLTMHVGLKYPTAFSRLAVLSPSVWWDHRVIVREVESLPNKLPFRIWLDAGTAEGGEVLRDTRALRDALKAKGWVEGADLEYHEVEGGQHNEASWATRVGPFLKFLYPRKGKG
jgi:predicted alpha/beta superfamily hydrolase